MVTAVLKFVLNWLILVSKVERILIVSLVVPQRNFIRSSHFRFLYAIHGRILGVKF